MISEKCLIGTTAGLASPGDVLKYGGKNDLLQVVTSDGYQLGVTEQQQLVTKTGPVPAKMLTSADRLILRSSGFGEDSIEGGLAQVVGAFIGDGWISNNQAVLALGKHNGNVAIELASALEKAPFRAYPRPIKIRTGRTALEIRTGEKKLVACLKKWAVLDAGSARKRFTDAVWTLSSECMRGLLQGVFSTDGTVGTYRGGAHISLDSTAMPLLQQVQLMLLQFGIKSSIYANRDGGATSRIFPDGKGGHAVYPVQPWHSLRITRANRVLYEKHVGFISGSYKEGKLRIANMGIDALPSAMSTQLCHLRQAGTGKCWIVDETLLANGLVVTR